MEAVVKAWQGSVVLRLVHNLSTLPFPTLVQVPQQRAGELQSKWSHLLEHAWQVC